MDKESTSRLIDAYIALLRVNPVSMWRMDNQAMYIELRNQISVETGLTNQQVQEKYESVAFELNNPFIS